MLFKKSLVAAAVSATAAGSAVASVAVDPCGFVSGVLSATGRPSRIGSGMTKVDPTEGSTSTPEYTPPEADFGGVVHRIGGSAGPARHFLGPQGHL